MKNAIAIAAVAGLAATVSAQPLTITFLASESTVTENATVTWTLIASWTGGVNSDDYFAAVNVNLVGLGTAGGTASPMTGMDWHNPALGALLTGTADGTSLNDIFGAQQALFGEVIRGTPFVIGSFSVTYSAEGDASYGLEDRNANAAFAIIFGGINLCDPPLNYHADDVTLISDTVTVTPAPSGVALLCLGGLAASRRRRGPRIGKGACR